MNEQWKEFDAKTLTGEDRTYNVKIMSCEAGLKLWHEHFAAIMAAVGSFGGKDADIFQLGMAIVESFPWELVKTFSKELLSSAKVKIDKVEYELDADGFGDCFAGNPIEFFTAIYHAAMANYQPLMSQLTEKKKAAKKK